MREISNITELAQALETTVERLKRDVYKYTECGAWIDWDDEEVRIGSIVEGSDAEVGPYHLPFPFTMQDYERTMQTVEYEADIYWHEANGDPEEDDPADWWEPDIKFYTSANPWDAPGMKISDFL